MSERIEMPSEDTQQTRWYRHECILCADIMPPDASYSAQYCGKACRVKMTKLRRQAQARRATTRLGATQ